MSFDLEKEEAKYREERKTSLAVHDGKNERQDDSSEQNVSEKSISDSFMWSAFFGGPIISYLTHLSEIRRSGKSYFWVVFGICIIPRFIVTGIDRAIERTANNLTVSANYVDMRFYVYCVLETVLLVAFNLFMAFVAARRFNIICPNFNADDYQHDEKRGVIAGAILWLILCTLNMLRS